MTDESIFAAALAIRSPRDRAAFLNRACADNSALRAEVEALLAAHAASNVLDHPPVDLARTGAYEPGESPLAHASGSPAVGDRIGPYKLLERIGEGGMGEVWVADQLEPIKRRVALKLIKPGMDSRSVLGRFEAERQALAVMDHPNIAKVLDAGTTPDGRPFFVMELVKGTPITEFCDARKLTPRERLALFVPVCQAIQHAHMKGIIHRDIKPSNVLVALHDEVPVPKVIDFGVAKAVGQQLTEMTIYTGFGALVGTPAYMAPEQATFNQLDIDTRADVYALGVLLYELLAGSPPVEPERMKKAALDEVLRIVREEEPPRPSQRLSTSQAKATIAATRQTDAVKLSALMRGELDWIVMKALEKDRARRYDTPTALAKDVQRYLGGDMVEARPPTLGYRLRKAYRRNRAAMLVGGAFAAVMLAAVGISLTFGIQATRAERDADRQRELAEADRAAAIEAGQEADRRRAETNESLNQLQLVQRQQADDQYVWDMQTVPLAFDASSMNEVKRILARHVPAKGLPDRRGFEWHYWNRQVNPELRTLQLPNVVPCTFTQIWEASPDGARVARLASVDGGGGVSRVLLTVWECATGTVILDYTMPISVPAFSINSRFSPALLVFSPDGKRIAAKWNHYAGSYGLRSDSFLQVLELSIPRFQVCAEFNERMLEGRGYLPMRCAEVAFSADGRRFAAIRPIAREPLPDLSRKAQIHVWDLQTGREMCDPIAASGLADAALSPDGTRIVIARNEESGGQVSVCDAATGKEHVGWVVPGLAAFAVSPDGARVATVTKGTAGVMNLKPVEQKLQLLQVWDAGTGMELYAVALPSGHGLPPGREWTVGIVFSPDGKRVVVWRNHYTSRQQRATSECLLWEVAKDAPVRSLQEFGEGSSAPIGPSRMDPVDSPWIRFTPDGQRLAWSESHVMRVCDWVPGQSMSTLRGHINPIAACGFAASGTQIWAVDSNGLLKEWDARPQRPEPIRFKNVVSNGPWPLVAVSDDGSRIAAVVTYGDKPNENPTEVHVWDTMGQRLQVLVPPRRDLPPQRSQLETLHRLSLSRDGRWAILTRREAKVIASPEALLLLEDAVVQPSDLTVWEVASGRQLFLRRFDPGDDLAAAISPDGNAVAVAVTPSAADEATHTPTFRRFNLPDGTERAPLVGPENTYIYGLSFSPNGRRLLGYGPNRRTQDGSRDMTFVGWDLAAGSRLFTIEAGLGGARVETRLAWSPDAARFAFSHNRGDVAVVTLHDAATGTTLRTIELPDTGGSGYRNPPSLAFSPDGRRIAADYVGGLQSSVALLKLFDAASGKEVMSVRTTTDGSPFAFRFLRFSSDGHRLMLTSNPLEDRIAFAERHLKLQLTTWDATPMPEPKP